MICDIGDLWRNGLIAIPPRTSLAKEGDRLFSLQRKGDPQ
jgi:hypothetical protein